MMWADVDEAVLDVEARAQASGTTLGPVITWSKSMTVRELCATTHAYVANPCTARLEPVVAFIEQKDGAWIRARVRVVPQGRPHWLKASGRDTGDVHAFIRALVRDGVMPFAIWTELASAWIAFTGAMHEAFVGHMEKKARERGLETTHADAPVGAAFAHSFSPEVKTWETLGPRDSIVLADAWAVLAR
jgi:hypothetical protein